LEEKWNFSSSNPLQAFLRSTNVNNKYWNNVT